MNFRLIAAVVAVVAFAGTSSVMAQGCGCDGGFGAYSGVVESSFGGYGSYGDVGYSAATCHRGLTSSAASSLWAGYCTDDCSYKGPPRKKLFGGCGLRHGGCGGGCGGGGGGCFGYGGSCGGGCGVDQSFSYPVGDCGGGASYVSSVRGGGCGGGHFGGGGCALKQKLAAKGGCGLRGGCLSGGCGGGGKFMGRIRAAHGGCGCSAPAPVVSECSTCLSGACDTCGDCGSNSYFSQAIGYEYGNAGMQSYVGGSLTSACGCGG